VSTAIERQVSGVELRQVARHPARQRLVEFKCCFHAKSGSIGNFDDRPKKPNLTHLGDVLPIGSGDTASR
jgi:hypothetical protein